MLGSARYTTSINETKSDDACRCQAFVKLVEMSIVEFAAHDDESMWPTI